MSQSTRRPLLLLGAIGLTAAAVLTLFLPGSEVDGQPQKRVGGEGRSQALPSAQAQMPMWTASVALAPSQGAYLSDRVMVRPVAGFSVHDVGAALGLAVLREQGSSGYGALEVPAGHDVGDALTSLAASDLVRDAGPMALVYGAAEGSPLSPTWSDLAWHHDAVGTSFVPESLPISSVTVAVLDTGVAYEDYVEDGISYAAAPGLAAVDIVAPKDFVNDDLHANDDNHHGTHIAGLIAAQGQTIGVASGVKLMPVKVLDSSNAGTELDLIEGLWHAIDNQADVINMSLAFREGYVPSAALSDVLLAARDEEIVMVAATGNTAADRVSWPAASPWVIGVTATCLDGTVAPYANRSGQVSVAAPGGCLDRDQDDNGYGDGLVAESFAVGSPDDVGLWLMAGSSQASAVASGAAAQILAAGASGAEVEAYLQATAGQSTWQGYFDGVGSGQLDVGEAASAASEEELRIITEMHTVSLLPYLRDEGTKVRPSAKVVVRDADGGLPPNGLMVYLRFEGSTSLTSACWVHKGSCDVLSWESVPKTDAAGWVLSVDAVRYRGQSLKVEAGIFASDSLDALVTALNDDPTTRDLPLGIQWSGGAVPGLHGNTSPAYTWINTGVGFASSPLATLFTPNVFAPSSLSSVTIDTGGVGFASSPLGSYTFKKVSLTPIDLGGVGFASSPLALAFAPNTKTGTVSMLAFDGVGFASSPIALSATTVYSGATPTNIYTKPVYTGQVIGLSTGDAVGVDMGSTALGDLISDGGWTLGGGVPVGSALSASSIVDQPLIVRGAGGGDGAQVVE